MDEEYDVIVFGTGLKECVLSGLMSTEGQKVMHLDRNKYYGGECASLNLTNLWSKFRPGEELPHKDVIGTNREWNVDLIPKFIMASGKLVHLLLKTKVTKYLEFKSVDGTYTYQYQAPGMFSSEKFIHKVPSTDIDAMKSPLLGVMEKTRIPFFFRFVLNFDQGDASSWPSATMDPARTPMHEIYRHYNLEPKTQEFLGHSVALYTSDEYLNRPYGEAVDKMKLYINSIARYGNSPFIYPIYGLGGLPEGFSRLCATHGGTFMLGSELQEFLFDDQGKVCGVKVTDYEGKPQTVKCKKVICDPSYVQSLPGKVKATRRVVRSICLLSHPIMETNDASSCQIIIPQKELNRQSDVYVMMISGPHQICKQGMYVAIVSTTVETDNPEREIQPALNLLGKVDYRFTYVSDVYTPVDKSFSDNIFISESYDATSHFESTANDILQIYKQITGSELDLTIMPNEDEE